MAMDVDADSANFLEFCPEWAGDDVGSQLIRDVWSAIGGHLVVDGVPVGGWSSDAWLDPRDEDRRWRCLVDRGSDDTLLLLVGCEGDQVLLAKPKFSMSVMGARLDQPKVIRPEPEQNPVEAALKILWGRRRSFRACVLCGQLTAAEQGETAYLGQLCGRDEQSDDTRALEGFACYGCLEKRLGRRH